MHEYIFASVLVDFPFEIRLERQIKTVPKQRQQIRIPIKII